MKGYFVMSEMNKIQIFDDSLQLVRLAYGYNYFEVNPLMKFGQYGLDPTGKHPAVSFLLSSSLILTCISCRLPLMRCQSDTVSMI